MMRVTPQPDPRGHLSTPSRTQLERTELGEGAQPWDQTLRHLVCDPWLECQWIDLLSQLEYVGFRKIAKAVAFENVSLSVLQHAAEEASHAHLLKQLAVKLGGAQTSWKESVMGRIGWHYFSELDRLASQEVQATHCYPIVSWVVEQRVMQVYPRYLALTQNDHVKRTLRRILAQEERHGKDFEENPVVSGQKQRLLSIELPLWERFCEELGRLCQSSKTD